MTVEYSGKLLCLLHRVQKERSGEASNQQIATLQIPYAARKPISAASILCAAAMGISDLIVVGNALRLCHRKAHKVENRQTQQA
jgi:hypothetical protein